jgi:UPF0755 protein
VTRRAARRRSSTGRRIVGTLGCLVALGLAAAAGVAGWGWWRLGEPFQGFAGDGVTVTVEPGTPAGAILERLEDEGVLADAGLTRLWLVWRLGDPPLHAGEYRFEGTASAHRVLDKLIRGEVVTHKVTLVEGQTLEETAATLAAAGFGDREAFERAMRDPAPIADLDPVATDLEGYLFPDTYGFARGTSETEIVAALVRSARDRWARVEARRREAAGAEPAPPATVRELVTLASIVEKEARLDEERPRIAAVYANPLSRGIALYADPTVIFALKRLGRWDGNLRRPDLELDSPYNTYRYPGLPPGPICSPGLASLLAAAAPADVPYLYFVSRNDGSHVFSETLAEHNRNVARWQKQYWRERWAAEGRRK